MCVDCVDDYFGENEAFLTKRLHESLPIKRTIHIRNGVAYLTVRAWRQREKAQQIAAFKRLKRCPSSDLVGYATDDLAATLTALFGAGRDLTFTHVPCGHSGHAQCLSRRLAEEVAAACGGRYMPLWHDRPQTGSSHPRTIVARPPLRWKSWPAGRTIVIDDVATSGAHLAETILALRSNGIAAAGIAWIGNDSNAVTTIAPPKPCECCGQKPDIEATALAAQYGLFENLMT